MGFMILCSLAATSLALAIGAWCKTTTMSLVVLPMVSRRAGASRAGAATSLLFITCPRCCLLRSRQPDRTCVHTLGFSSHAQHARLCVCCSWVAGSGGVPPVWRLLPVTRQPAKLLHGEEAPAPCRSPMRPSSPGHL